MTVKNESEEIHFHQKFKSPPLQNRDDSFKWKKYVEENKYRYDKYQGSFRKKSKNPLDSNGKVTRCWICDSVNHWSRQCPDRESYSFFEETLPNNSETNFSETFNSLTLHMSDHRIHPQDLVSESFNSAVVDTGASKTVCGEKWFRGYINTLNKNERKEVKYFRSNNVFSFGNEQTMKSLQEVEIPVRIGKVKAVVRTDVVDMNIPLLLSLASMKKGGVTNFNIMDGTLTILHQKVKLKTSKSGHFLLPLQGEAPKLKSSSIKKQSFNHANSVSKNVILWSQDTSKRLTLENQQPHGVKKKYNPNCKRNLDKIGSKNYLGRCKNFEKMHRFSYNAKLDSLISNKNRKVVRNEVEISC